MKTPVTAAGAAVSIATFGAAVLTGGNALRLSLPFAVIGSASRRCQMVGIM